MAYQNQSSVYMTTVHQLFCAMCNADFNQSVTKIVLHHTPDSCTCTLKVFRVSSKREFAHFYLAFNSAKITVSLFYILKAKSIQAFMNGNVSLTLGLYHRLMTCFAFGNRQ